MDTDLIYPLTVYIIWGVILAYSVYSGKKYEACRMEAFRSMEKIRIAVYCVPLIFSVLFAIFIHPKLTQYFGGLRIMIIAIGMFAWLVLFDLFESNRVKRSRAA